MNKLVLGVAVNDVKEGKTPYYLKWYAMLSRCYGKYIPKTYEGCSVCEEWLIFSNFREWMIAQDWEGKDLDKDLLVPGNKVYSPDTCIFVPPAVNLFTHRGYTGYFRKGKYEVNTRDSITHKRIHLGRHADFDSAYRAWVTQKLCELGKLQELYDLPNNVVAAIKRGLNGRNINK